jgi:hypothetical protein
MSRILKLAEDDSEKELDFELEFRLSLTIQQRFDMMFQKSNELSQMLREHEYRKAFEIIKRE